MLLYTNIAYISGSDSLLFYYYILWLIIIDTLSLLPLLSYYS